MKEAVGDPQAQKVPFPKKFTTQKATDCHLPVMVIWTRERSVFPEDVRTRIRIQMAKS